MINGAPCIQLRYLPLPLELHLKHTKFSPGGKQSAQVQDYRKHLLEVMQVSLLPTLGAHLSDDDISPPSPVLCWLPERRETDVDPEGVCLF